MRTQYMLSALVLAMSACVTDFMALTSLSEAQAIRLCEEVEPRTITCGDDDFSFTIELGGECDVDDGISDIPLECTATVGDYRSCMYGFASLTDEQLCEGGLPTDCDALFSDECVVAE